jgi:hypothetical protein
MNERWPWGDEHWQRAMMTSAPEIALTLAAMIGTAWAVRRRTGEKNWTWIAFLAVIAGGVVRAICQVLEIGNRFALFELKG